MYSSYTYSCPGNPGDLLLFRRPAGYDHYAVNVGNGDIVHVTSAEDITSFDAVGSSIGSCCSSHSSGGIAVVKREPYANFKKPGDRVTVEDGTWRGKTALRRIEIVRRALSRVGEKGYNLLLKNCEHFARWCRYGEETSDQAINFGTAALVTVGAIGLLGLGAYLLSDSEEEKKEKQRYRRQ